MGGLSLTVRGELFFWGDSRDYLCVLTLHDSILGQQVTRMDSISMKCITDVSDMIHSLTVLSIATPCAC